MVLKIFAVQDLKAKAFLSPFTYATVGQAVRTMSDMVNRPAENRDMFAVHTEDFVLFQVGEFDTESGKVTGELSLIGPLRNFKTGGDT